MKKFLKSFAAFFLLANLLLLTNVYVATAKTPIEKIQEVGTNTKLPQFQIGQHPDAPPDYSQEGIGTFTSPIYFAIDLFRYVVSAVAILVIVFSAIKLISTSNEEDAGKVKDNLVYGIVGLLVIQIADVAVKKMFFGEQGEILENAANAQIYAEESVRQIRGIIGFFEAFLGAIAVLVMIIRGFTLVTSAGDEEAMGKAKTQIMYALVGLFIVGLSELVVRGFIFPDAGQSLPDVNKGRKIIVMITNYIAGFVSIISFATLFYAGYRYVVSAGNEEETGKVKEIITGSLIGLILALGAFAAVNTLIEFEAPADSASVSLQESQ